MNHVAPQEDRLELPAAWKAKLLPWRGRRAGKPFEPADPEAFDGLRQKIAARLEKLQAALANPENAAYADDAAAFLAERPNPRGAAAVAALILNHEARAAESWLRPEFDWWLHEHGLAFAVAAAVERLAVSSTFKGYYGGGGPIAKRIVFEHYVEHSETAVHELQYGGIAAVRALLAAASDEAYAEVVAAVAGHRDTPAKRVAAMLLLPGEHEWVLEACTEFGKARAYSSPSDKVVWHSLSRPEHAAAAGLGDLDAYLTDLDTVAAVLSGLGADALPILIETEQNAYGAEQRKIVCRAIGLVPADEATEHLFRRLDRPQVFDGLVETAARYPVRALRAAARIAPTLPAEPRRLAIAVAGAVDPSLHAHLDATDRAVVDDLLAGSGRVPEADPADLPPLLVTPPWDRKQPKTKRVVLDGLESPAEARLCWAEGEHEAWRALERTYYLRYSETQWREFAERAHRGRYYWDTEVLAYAPDSVAVPFAERWDGELSMDSWPDQVRRVLARFGIDVADRLVTAIADRPALTETLLPVRSVGAARIAAHRLGGKSTRAAAAAWFERHGTGAVPYLVPDALGSDAKRRRHAEFALAHLADLHGIEAVAAGAEPYGPEAVAAIAAMLGVDPLVPRVKLPKPGTWAAPAILPQVLLRGGERAIPTELVPNLIAVLALATPDYAYPGVAVLAEACDRASLTRFGRALFDQWSAAGAPSKDAWALTQLMHFADDATVWHLAPRIREWPGQSQHKRAVTGLEVLGAIGTEEALRAIQTIAEKVKFKALKEEANRQIARIAEELDLSREQLADRLVPDFGLGEDAALVLDYGPRTFTVAFDEQLKPFVRDSDGKPRKTLPKPSAKDDPEIAEESYQRFAALKKELRSVAADQVRRIEHAMVAGREWPVDEFRRYFAEHPLTRHLARRLVWLADTGGDRFGFRIAEDGSFSDVEDDTVALPEAARIRVAHPVHFGPEKTAAWAEVFADYEILQPFDQLNRPILAFTEDDLATGRLTRFEGVKVEVGRLLGMTGRGWNRASPGSGSVVYGDGGIAPGLAHPLPGGGCVTVALDPGIYVGYPQEYPEQTLRSVRLAVSERYDWSEQDEPERPVDIDPLTASEILASLARLTRAGS